MYIVCIKGGYFFTVHNMTANITSLLELEWEKIFQWYIHMLKAPFFTLIYKIFYRYKKNCMWLCVQYAKHVPFISILSLLYSSMILSINRLFQLLFNDFLLEFFISAVFARWKICESIFLFTVCSSFKILRFFFLITFIQCLPIETFHTIINHYFKRYNRMFTQLSSSIEIFIHFVFDAQGYEDRYFYYCMLTWMICGCDSVGIGNEWPEEFEESKIISS